MNDSNDSRHEPSCELFSTVLEATACDVVPRSTWSRDIVLTSLRFHRSTVIFITCSRYRRIVLSLFSEMITKVVIFHPDSASDSTPKPNFLPNKDFDLCPYNALFRIYHLSAFSMFCWLSLHISRILNHDIKFAYSLSLVYIGYNAHL